jgi:hypothetical protein
MGASIMSTTCLKFAVFSIISIKTDFFKSLKRHVTSEMKPLRTYIRSTGGVFYWIAPGLNEIRPLSPNHPFGLK